MLRPLAAAAVAALAFAAPASAHEVSPHYLTRVNTISPTSKGVTVDVINRSEKLELRNLNHQNIVIGGYNGDQYARLLANGTVEVNTHSPAYYLNEDRFGTTRIPAGITGSSTPKWKVLDKTGRFQWHDHRMHWMSHSTPPQVKDKGVRTKIFDWKVPLTVDGRKGDIAGTLFWTPRPGAPVGLIVAIGVLMVGLCGFAVVVRLRRREPGGTSSDAW